MSSIVGALVLGLVIFFFWAREVSHYRADRRTRAHVVPYTRSRLVRRCLVSFCLLAEVILLLVLRHTLSAQAPIWFLIYVLLVLGVAGAMVLLAYLDVRESAHLASEGGERLYKEFLTELRHGESPPPIH